MSKEKPKKREYDELYSVLVKALYKTIVQVTEIYNMAFDDVCAHIEQEHHGC